MPRELDSVAKALNEGRTVEPTTVRVFLSWFDAQRRGIHVVREIREHLKEVGVETEPDFEPAWIDSLIGFRLTPVSSPLSAASTSDPSGENETVTAADPSALGGDAPAWVSRDPTYRISKLEAANAGVVRMAPDETIAKAGTLMLASDFSQLPVMTTDREVKGIVSWRSIGSRLAMGIGPERVGNAMEQAYEVPADTSIFEGIALIVRHGYVLVRARNGLISGIVTASDLSLQFQMLTEPFLVLSEIENLLRNMIGACFKPAELADVQDLGSEGREVNSVYDLTFGEYIRLLQNPERWARLKTEIDRKLFCDNLDLVREVRNDVMHFDPDGITAKNLSDIRKFAQFLKKMEELRA